MTELIIYLMTALLFGALSIFGGLAMKSRSIRTFQFQISIFIIIWVVGEITNIVMSNFYAGDIAEEIGMKIHLVAMVAFAILLWTRFYHSKRTGKKIFGDSSDYYTG